MTTAITTLEILTAAYVTLQFLAFAWSKAGSTSPTAAPVKEEAEALTEETEGTEEPTDTLTDDDKLEVLQAMTCTHLRKLASDAKVARASRLRKAEAIAALLPRWAELPIEIGYAA